MTTRNDSLTGLLQSSLRKVMPELIVTEYPEYKFQQSLIPIDPTQSPGAATITYQRITHTGVWQPLAAQTTSVARSDFGTEPVTYNTEYFGTSYVYTVEEIDRLNFANSNVVGGIALDLTREKVAATLQGYQQLIERTLTVGIPGNNIFGILTHPDCSRLFTSTPIIASNTGDVNLAILTNSVANQVTATDEVERPDIVVLPTSTYEILSTQRLGGSSDTTVLRHFLNTSPHIRAIESSPRLEAAGTFGGKVMLTYRRDRSKLVGCIPKRYTALPPEQKAYGYEVYVHAQVGGIHIKKPRSVTITEGI